MTANVQLNKLTASTLSDADFDELFWTCFDAVADGKLAGLQTMTEFIQGLADAFKVDANEVWEIHCHAIREYGDRLLNSIEI